MHKLNPAKQLSNKRIITIAARGKTSKTLLISSQTF